MWSSYISNGHQGGAIQCNNGQLIQKQKSADLTRRTFTIVLLPTYRSTIYFIQEPVQDVCTIDDNYTCAGYGYK